MVSSSGLCGSKYDLVLSYFPIKAVGQIPQYVMHAGSLQYKFDLTISDNWETEKLKMPFDQLPILNVKGHGVLAQSCAITQYVASLAGFLPSDPFLRSRVLMVYEQYNAILRALGNAKYSGNYKWGPRVNGSMRFYADKMAQDKAYDELRAEKLPVLLRNLEKLFPVEGFFLGEEFGLSLADVSVFAAVQMLTEIGEVNVLRPFPKLNAIHASVLQIGTMKEFLENDKSCVYYIKGDHQA